ncbi:MAG: hypothetical protein HKN85_11705, partial [Gammaproteobacteria bacterium]|nr:hypothetical protein [Gammaproteobacteria bacterium]
NLHSSSSHSAAAVSKAAGALDLLAQAAQKLFSRIEPSLEQRQQMLDAVMQLGVQGEYHDYIAAEQGVMAMDALSFSLPENPALASLVSGAYRLTENDETYVPEKLKRALIDYLKR